MYYHGVFEIHPLGWPRNSMRRAGASFSASYIPSGINSSHSCWFFLKKLLLNWVSSNDTLPLPLLLPLKLLLLIKIQSVLQRPQSKASFTRSLPPSSFPAPPSFLCWKIGMTISESARGKLRLEEEIVANEQLRGIQYPSPQHLVHTFPSWPCHLTPWILP